MIIDVCTTSVVVYTKSGVVHTKLYGHCFQFSKNYVSLHKKNREV